MSFTPVIPLGGVSGWALLQRIETSQRAAFDRRPDVTRDLAYFRSNIGGADSAAKLVADRRLLTVALTAFGLEGEIGKRALIRRVLESDPADRTSLAGRMIDPRYKAFAEAFGYGLSEGTAVGAPGFADRIAASFRERRFETAVGQSDPSLRLALNARRELAAYANSRDPNGAAWFSVLGDVPLRKVVETAFGLPDSFSQLDVDRQRDELRTRMRAQFGDPSLAALANPANLDTLIRRFLAREAAAAGPSLNTPGATALVLLGGGAGLGSIGASNLFQSRLF